MTKLEQLNALLQQTPGDPFLHYAIGLELVKAGDLVEAVERFEMLLKNNPDYIGTYYQLGKLYEVINEAEKALKVYNEGMNQSQEKEVRAYNELQTAYNNLLFNTERMNHHITAAAFRVNFKRVFTLIMIQGFLFLAVLAIAFVVVLSINLPVYVDVPVLIFVLLSDSFILIYQMRQIFNDSNEIPTILTLMEGAVQEKVTENDEIRLIPFSNIIGFSLGQANYPELQNYFRIKLRNSNEEVYMTTAETSKQDFFNFTEEFVGQIENYNSKVLPGVVKIKRLK